MPTRPKTTPTRSKRRGPEDTVRITIDLDPSTHRKLKIWCVQHDTTIADLIRGLLNDHFDATGNGTPSADYKAGIASGANTLAQKIRAFIDAVVEDVDQGVPGEVHQAPTGLPTTRPNVRPI